MNEPIAVIRRFLLCLITLAAIAPATQSEATSTSFIVPVDVGRTRLILFDTDFNFTPPAGLAMNGEQVSITYALSKPVRVFTQTQTFFIVASFDTNAVDSIPWGPVSGTLLDINGNPILEGPALTGGGNHEFVFDPLWYPDIPLDSPRPFLFYGIRFDLTMPNDLTHQIIDSDRYDLRIGAQHGYVGFGFGKGDITGPPGVPETGSTLALLSAALCGLLSFKFARKTAQLD